MFFNLQRLRFTKYGQTFGQGDAWGLMRIFVYGCTSATVARMQVKQSRCMLGCDLQSHAMIASLCLAPSAPRPAPRHRANGRATGVWSLRVPWAVALPVVARCAKRDGVVEDGSLRGDRPKVRYSWRLGGVLSRP